VIAGTGASSAGRRESARRSLPARMESGAGPRAILCRRGLVVKGRVEVCGVRGPEGTLRRDRGPARPRGGGFGVQKTSRRCGRSMSVSARVLVREQRTSAAALLSPDMAAMSPLLAGGLLVAAGVFQWTPLKRACLAACRSPLSFLMTAWREGRAGAFVMGFRHGLYCLGCCWALMALLFVAGVMNLLWVAAIAVVVLVEKVVPRGDLVGRLAGVVFVAAGGLLVARGFIG